MTSLLSYIFTQAYKSVSNTYTSGCWHKSKVVLQEFVVFYSLIDPETYKNEKKKELDENGPLPRYFSYLPAYLNE